MCFGRALLAWSGGVERPIDKDQAMRAVWILMAALPALAASPAAAQEIYGGVYKHRIDTFMSRDIGEGGVDFQLGYRFAPQSTLWVIGKPSPYAFGSVNSQGDTDFAAAGLSWKLGIGPVFVRPGLGIAIHDGPSHRVDPESGQRTDLGSRVVFEPEIAIGTRLTDRLDLEASWVHLSHARLFNSKQNPGLDVIGMRLSYRLH
jgi:hypothetical protein